MTESNSKALVPFNKLSPPALRNEKARGIAPLELVAEDLHLSSRDEVRNLLPDILGKVLARVWLDTGFHKQFSQDPQLTLERNGVFLPENMSIEFQKQDTDRPRIVVYQQKPGSKFKLRVFYLQLVMMAGR